MKGVATWVWIIVAVVGAVAIIYLGMSYGIIPLTGELGKWICYRQMASTCDLYFREGETKATALKSVWNRCEGFFSDRYSSAEDFCRGEFKYETTK